MMRIERPSPDTDNERGAIPTNVVIDNIMEDPCVFLEKPVKKFNEQQPGIVEDPLKLLKDLLAAAIFRKIMVIRWEDRNLPWGMKAQEKTVQQCIVRAVGLCRRYKDTFLAQTAPFPEVYARGSLVFVSMAGTSIEPGCLYRGYLPGYTVTQGHTLALEKKMLVSERCLWGRYLSASSDVDFLQVLSIDKSPQCTILSPGVGQDVPLARRGVFVDKTHWLAIPGLTPKAIPVTYHHFKTGPRFREGMVSGDGYLSFSWKGPDGVNRRIRIPGAYLLSCIFNDFEVATSWCQLTDALAPGDWVRTTTPNMHMVVKVRGFEMLYDTIKIDADPEIIRKGPYDLMVSDRPPPPFSSALAISKSSIRSIERLPRLEFYSSGADLYMTGQWRVLFIKGLRNLPDFPVVKVVAITRSFFIGVSPSLPGLRIGIEYDRPRTLAFDSEAEAVSMSEVSVLRMRSLKKLILPGDILFVTAEKQRAKIISVAVTEVYLPFSEGGLEYEIKASNTGGSSKKQKQFTVKASDVVDIRMASDEDQPDISMASSSGGNTSIHLARWVKAPPNDSPQCINPVKITATGILAFGTVGGKEGGVSIRCYPFEKIKSMGTAIVDQKWNGASIVAEIMAFRKSCKQGAPPSVPT